MKAFTLRFHMLIGRMDISLTAVCISLAIIAPYIPNVLLLPSKTRPKNAAS